MKKVKKNWVKAEIQGYCNYEPKYKSPEDRRKYVSRITGEYFTEQGIEYRRSFFAEPNIGFDEMKKLAPKFIIVDSNK